MRNTPYHVAFFVVIAAFYLLTPTTSTKGAAPVSVALSPVAERTSLGYHRTTIQSVETQIIPVVHGDTEWPAVVMAHYEEPLDWLHLLGPNLHFHIVHKAHRFPGSIYPLRPRVSPSNISLTLRELPPTDGKAMLDLLTAPDTIMNSAVDIHAIVPIAGARVSVMRVSNEDGWGRECSGYISWILRNYDNLPPKMVFLQALPTRLTATDGPEHRLMNNFEQLRAMLLRPRSGPRDDFSFAAPAPGIFRRCHNNSHWGCCNLHDDDLDFLKTIGIDLPALHAAEAVVWEPKQVQCSLSSIHVTSATTGQFVVTREAVRRLSKEQWARVLHFALRPVRFPTSTGNPNKTHWWPMTHCHILEHVWHLIFGRNPNHVNCSRAFFDRTNGVTNWLGGCAFTRHPVRGLAS